jgi:imidazolonepropionase-like amidohydrolase
MNIDNCKAVLKSLLVLLSISTMTLTLQAIVPVPSKAQDGAIAITGVTVHTGNGDVIDNAVLTFDKGKITSLTTADKAPALDTFEVIEMNGKHLYPGFILPNTSIGLVEVNSVRATRDQRERGSLNPNVRSIIAYNTDSELIPTLRFNGILMAQVTPEGGMISGSSSVVQLDAWNWEDAAYVIDDGIHLNWPNLYKRRYDFATFTVKTEKSKTYKQQVQTLKSLFENASVYDGKSGLNLKLQAMTKLFTDKGRLFIHADGAREIISSISFARSQGVKNIVIVGGADAMMVKDLLVEEKIPVIVAGVHSLPAYEDDDIDAVYKLPAQLIAAGVKVGLGTSSTIEPMGARNLPFMAGNAAAYGIDKEAALTMITRTNAEILGIDKSTGTIEVGKDATLFISEGDALDMRGNQIIRAFIAGRKIALYGTQQELFDRYQKKYSE